MRVRIMLSLDVDAAAWAAEYGIPVEDVRQDVVAHVGHSIRATLRDAGLLLDGGA